MWNGGNTKLYHFLQGYNLAEEGPYQKYNTNACEYYRHWLEAEAQGITCGETAPAYDYGRQQI